MVAAAAWAAIIFDAGVAEFECPPQLGERVGIAAELLLSLYSSNTNLVRYFLSHFLYLLG